MSVVYFRGDEMTLTNQTLKMKQRPYVIGITLNIVFVLAELIFAKIAHSTALFLMRFTI